MLIKQSTVALNPTTQKPPPAPLVDRIVIQRTVFFVDDRQDIRMLATPYLSLVPGITAHILSNGRDALSALATVHPDVLVTDINMPEMTGFELIKRARELYPDLKIVIFSAGIRESSKKELELQGIIVLDKSVGFDDLIKCLT